jgi:DNA (cytosine-5)-methyltransferase 1
MTECIAWMAGVGGSSRGAEMAGCKVLAAIDIDTWALEAHARNMPGTRAIRFDLAQLAMLDEKTVAVARDLIRRCGVDDPESWEGLHVFTAPCPGFSKGGRLQAGDPRNRLVFGMLPVLAATPRSRLVFENVPCFLLEKFEGIHEELFEGLESLRGARLTREFLARYVINSADCGVPQSRCRLVFPVMREGERYPDPPKPTCLRHRTLGQCVGPGFHDLDPHTHRLTTLEKRMVRNVQPGQNWKEGLAEPFVEEFAEEHGWHIYTKPTGTLRVMGWHESMPTICASTDYHISRVEPLHPHKRRLTAGERREIQGFPKDWVIFGPLEDRLRLIGNAVPPKMMAEAIRAYFHVAGAVT